MATADDSVVRPHITEEVIKKICRTRDDLYDTVSLNDKMFLQYGSFTEIENMQLLSHIHTLWLDYNSISAITNVAPLKNLTALYLSNNCLTALTGVAALPSLVILDVSRNNIAEIKPRDLEGMTALKSLDVSANRLSNIDGIVDAANLTTLTLADNFLASGTALAPLAALTSLRALTLKGNEGLVSDNSIPLKVTFSTLTDSTAASASADLDASTAGDSAAAMAAAIAVELAYDNKNAITHTGPGAAADRSSAAVKTVEVEANYRRATVALLRGLVYLDDRPVSKDERRIVTAWLTGGGAAEIAERAAIAAQEKRDHDRGMSRWAQMRRKAQGLPETTESDSGAGASPEAGASAGAGRQQLGVSNSSSSVGVSKGKKSGGALIEIIDDDDDESNAVAVVDPSKSNPAVEDEEDEDLDAIVSRNIFTLPVTTAAALAAPGAATGAGGGGAATTASGGNSVAYSVLTPEETRKYHASSKPYTQSMIGLVLGANGSGTGNAKGFMQSASAHNSDGDDDDDFIVTNTGSTNTKTETEAGTDSQPAAAAAVAAPAAPVKTASLAAVAVLTPADVINAVNAAFFQFESVASAFNAKRAVCPEAGVAEAADGGAVQWTEAMVREAYAAALTKSGV